MSGLQNVRFQNVWFQNVWFQTSIQIKAWIRPAFKFDVLIKQSIGIAKFAYLFKVKSVSYLLISSDYGVFLQLDFLKTWRFVNLTFCKPDIM
jgi:hypothetical protein